MKGVTLNDLNDHLFDIIERLKAGADPECDPKDTIPLEIAAAIVETSKVAVEIAKVKVAAAKIAAEYENPTSLMIGNGIIDQEELK